MKKLILISALLLVVGCEPKYDNKAELFPEEVIYETGYPGLIIKNVKCDLRSEPDGYSYEVLMFTLTHRAPDAEVTQLGDPQVWNEKDEMLDILFPEGVTGYIKVKIRDASGDFVESGNISFSTLEPDDDSAHEISNLGHECSRSDNTFMFSYLMNPQETTISSFQEKLKLDYHQIPSSLATGAGGGIEVLGDDSLLITLDNGEMFLFNTLKETFSINSFNLKGKYSGIRDILINKELSEYLVLGVVDTTNNCKAVKLDSFNYTFDKGIFKINNSEIIWESEEVCDIPTNSGAGGRIVFYQDNYFISTGYFSETIYEDFERGMHPFPQSPSSSFGKVIKIDRSKQNISSIYTLGHRVPEGLFVSNDKKQLFLTEHGPKGGDEINVLLEDNNYGWPCKTRGLMYGYPELYPVRWPEDLTVLGCKKNNFIEPLFTWTPSIAISQGIHYRGDYFKGFDNNFIIGSLGGLSLFRVFYQDGRVINQERIRVGERIRDILQTQDQRIVLYTDGGSLIMVSKSL